MPNRKRQGNDVKRRITPVGDINQEIQSNLAEARYTGSAHHKSKPADYGFHPPVNPRPRKSLCDNKRTITLREACRLFRSGIQKGMISSYLEDGLPKYVWAVDHAGEAYEAKLGEDGSRYHGYRMYRDQAMRRYIIREWRERNQ